MAKMISFSPASSCSAARQNGEDFWLLERFCDPSALDTDIVIGVALATPEDVDSALILPTAAVLNRVGVIQLVTKQDYATALQCPPILGFWDFVGEARK